MSNGHACCLLGVCCPPGSPAQRASLRAWLTGKLFLPDMPGKLYGPGSEVVIDSWLDELPWGTTAADFDAEGHRIAGLADDVGGEAV